MMYAIWHVSYVDIAETLLQTESFQSLKTIHTNIKFVLNFKSTLPLGVCFLL